VARSSARALVAASVVLRLYLSACCPSWHLYKPLAGFNFSFGCEHSLS
jgi:hypothetical protein